MLVLFGQENLAWYLKPFLLPFLLLAVYNSGGFETKNWLLFALVFSWIGDVILMFADKSELYFIFGLISFLIAHLLFIVLFIKQKSKNQHKKSKFFWAASLLVLFYLFKILSLLIPKLDDLEFPVSVYAITISLMLVEAIKGCFNWKNSLKYLILVGALFFVTSDSILAINKFYSPLPNASFLIMITYLIAQFCIVFGILKLNEKKIAFQGKNGV